jgi:hypothetical protein
VQPLRRTGIVSSASFKHPAPVASSSEVAALKVKLLKAEAAAKAAQAKVKEAEVKANAVTATLQGVVCRWLQATAKMAAVYEALLVKPALRVPPNPAYVGQDEGKAESDEEFEIIEDDPAPAAATSSSSSSSGPLLLPPLPPVPLLLPPLPPVPLLLPPLPPVPLLPLPPRLSPPV